MSSNQTKRLYTQLNFIQESVEYSPYLPKESREHLGREIQTARHSLQKESSNLLLWEKHVDELDHRVATHEIDAVIRKISQLNPLSLYLGELRMVAARLRGGTLSASESRKEIHRIMKH